MISPAEKDLLEVMDEGHRVLNDLRGETYPRNLLGAIRIAEPDSLASAVFTALVVSSDDKAPIPIRDLRDQWREDVAKRGGDA